MVGFVHEIHCDPLLLALRGKPRRSAPNVRSGERLRASKVVNICTEHMTQKQHDSNKKAMVLTRYRGNDKHRGCIERQKEKIPTSGFHHIREHIYLLGKGAQDAQTRELGLVRALHGRGAEGGRVGYVITGKYSKIHLDIIIITTTTEQHYIIRIAMKVMPGSNLSLIHI